MEEDENPRIEIKIELSKRCEKSYKKLSKKADPKLRKAINDAIDKLKTNPQLGKELTQDLKDMRSIRLAVFNYRIVYEVKDNHSKIIVHVIAHRKNVYDDVAKYFELGSYDPELY